MTFPGGSATIGEATLTYDKAGRLTSGNLDLPALTIAGLVPIEGVSLAYGPTGWSGAGSGGGVDIAFVVTEGELTSGHIAVAEATIGNVIGITDFRRSEEHTSELQSLMRISYAVFCLKKTKSSQTKINIITT